MPFCDMRPLCQTGVKSNLLKARFSCRTRFRLELFEPFFRRVTQLDFTGPLQVFSSVPDAKVHLIWKRIEPVPSDTALTVMPTTSFADCPQLDVICVPGGAGTDDMVNDEEVLDFVRAQSPFCEIRHVGLHGIAGSRLRWSVEGVQGDHALDRDGISCALRGAADQDAGMC